jgi:hypothetical protein
MDKTLQEIKLILEKRDLDRCLFGFKTSSSDEEAKIFLASVNNLNQYLN